MAVLQAMRELVAEQGYARVTIEGIAERAHVGKPTIYRWWQSKNAILAECVLSGDVLPTPVATDSPTGARYDAIVWFRAVLVYIDDNAPLLRGLVAAAYEDAAMSQQLETHLAEPIAAALREWVGGLADGEGGGGGGISGQALAQLVHGTILYRLARPPGSGDDASEEVFEILMARLGRIGD
ncbi:hypothetical protein B7R54_14925 [Subtercola boreus]|uniref:HTH tetR-type domain-containing protein n=1 Tax=Subtercola boreus TaxID=120213 RepID=A0A3E0VN92_9MICO|nr:hypothetical protein B7R54_14925 [Subtercola boreus]